MKSRNVVIHPDPEESDCFLADGLPGVPPNSLGVVRYEVRQECCADNNRKVNMPSTHPGMRVLLTLIVILTARDASGAQEAAPLSRQRIVFVLHSGLHTIFSDVDPNRVSDQIARLLVKQGVPEGDIVALENEYPVASWTKMFPAESLGIFLDSTKPGSRTMHLAYQRLHRALVERDVKPCDRLVWVGHSAGGQLGLTLAYLGFNLERFPGLARTARPYRFDMVVTLGSPLAVNPLPPEVKVRHYYSADDRVVRWACHYGTFVLGCLGHSIFLTEMPTHAGAMVRTFQGIEHPFWDTERVVNRILADVGRGHAQLWQTAPFSPSASNGLVQLLSRAVAEELHLSLEDPPE